MQCPFCEAEKERLKVIDSRTCDGGKAIRRRRQCLQCSKRFTTYEKVEQNIRLSVVKKDGRRVPWDQKKVYVGLERACFKRPVAQSDLQRIVDEVEEEIFRKYDREVPSGAVGALVTDRLRRVDQVAYVRFASVYKQFKTLEELIAEAKAVMDARLFEDPSQGVLWVDAARSQNNGQGVDGGNGRGNGRANEPNENGAAGVEPKRGRGAKTARRAVVGRAAAGSHG